MKDKYIERECVKHGLTKYKCENRNSYRCMKCAQDNVSEQRRKNKRKLIDQFGGRCELCGYDRCSRNLHFHHVDPSTKSFGLSASGHSLAFPRLLKEAAKCILVCGNCHGEIEEGILEVPPLLVERTKI